MRSSTGVVAMVPLLAALSAAGSPLPSKLEHALCEFAASKEVEDLAVGKICSSLEARFPNLHFNPDCRTDVGDVWHAAVTHCAAASPAKTLQSPMTPPDIEKLICDVLSQGEVEEMAVAKVCSILEEKFPAIKFQPDCPTDVKALWDAASAKCPKEEEMALPSPADIEKKICEVASQKLLEEEAVTKVCSILEEKFPAIKFQPDCPTDVKALWDAAVAKCPKEEEVALPSPADIEKMICEVASQEEVEEKAVAKVCSILEEKFPAIKFQPDCPTDVKALWDAAVAKCPKEEEVALPSPADIEKIICEVASQEEVEEKGVAKVCSVLEEKFPAIKFHPDCPTDIKALWEAAVARCPKQEEAAVFV